MAAGAAAVTAGGQPENPTPEAIPATGRIELAAFRSQLDTTFRVDDGAEPVSLTLAEVVAERPIAGVERFSLLFHGPSDRMLPQDTYSFHHDALGELTLFIVPVLGSNDARIVYEACFNRAIAAPGP
jgi:hypothetical protein